MKTLFKAFVELIENAVVSWTVSCGLIYLIALCFDLPCTLRIATGIWLVQAFIRITLKSVNTDKK